MTESVNVMNTDALNSELENKPAEEIVEWAVQTFGSRLCVQSSMQKSAGVLMHMITRVSPSTEIIFIDTGVHFPETLRLRDEFRERFGANIVTYSPEKSFDEQFAEYGRHLYESNDTEGYPGYRKCCELRKEIPYVNAVRGRFDAVIGGLMRSEGGGREEIKIVSWDPRTSAYKIYPLANWTEEDINRYTREHDLPVHALYERGFASIGCATCTTAIREGEDKRAGRWRHIRENMPDPATSPLYCGINFEDRKNSH